MATANLKPLFYATLAADSTLMYTVSSGVTIIKEITVCNIDMSTQQAFYMWIVPPSGTVGDGNLMYNALSLLSKETITISSNTYLTPGYTIYMKAASADKLNVYCSGVELV